jgi:hypothetical protein
MAPATVLACPALVNGGLSRADGRPAVRGKIARREFHLPKPRELDSIA